MKVRASEQKPSFEVIGNRVIFYFEEDLSSSTENGVDSTIYEYKAAEWSLNTSRSEIIEKIIQTKYPTVGAELAVINGGVEAEITEYQEWRVFSKTKADEWLSQ